MVCLIAICIVAISIIAFAMYINSIEPIFSKRTDVSHSSFMALIEPLKSTIRHTKKKKKIATRDHEYYESYLGASILMPFSEYLKNREKKNIKSKD